ncbi:MAG: hypothetical protein JO021_01285, partial [Alphaproteobacteria bacterium]|nr:hypothetical protein [Alphaproteobacteria bacterium]
MGIGLAAGLMLAAGVADAQQRPPEAEMARAATEMAKAVKGWPGGIAFTCVVAPAALETDAIKQLCARASASASTLAGQAKLKFAAEPDLPSFLQQVVKNRALGLTIVVS